MKLLGSTLPFLYIKTCGIFTQIQQKHPSQTPVAARLETRMDRLTGNIFSLCLTQDRSSN